jgi:hypothetical protein
VNRSPRPYLVLVLAVLATLGGLPGAPEAAAAPRPTAVVVLGDSAASGDGAGS